MISSILLAVIGAALVYALHRQGETHATTIAALVADSAADRVAHRDEIQTLLQRIQAPEVAVLQHAQETTEPVPTVRPMTDEESVAAADEVLAQEAQSVIDEMVRRENEVHGLITAEPAGVI